MPALNPFADLSAQPSSPAISMSAIVPSDSVDLPKSVRCIYVGGEGNVCVKDTEGNTVTHVGAPQGGYIGPFSVVRVMATGTTASNLIGYV